ncbi:MAG: SUMF1/EgtB/PvdO family nonheme iron enzyme [Bacteroidales bacterium]|nr:SUMF1/EgtB/PvdO family nonheme iron enzyme [Bacteroidales bacterium]
MEQKYDIFISYRREGGAQYARILQLMLKQRGYAVFLDYDELRDGTFSEKIVEAIKGSRIFMLVLSKGAFDRCSNEDDWLRIEIELALKEKKKIIPVDPDKSFDGIPKDAPESIQTAAGANQHSEIHFGQILGVTIDLMIKERIVPEIGDRTPQGQVDESFDQAKDSLNRLATHNRFVRRAVTIVAFFCVLAVLATCFYFITLQRKTENNKDRIEHLVKNHSQMHLDISDEATEMQLDAIDELLKSMKPLINDSIWICRYEMTQGIWNAVLGVSCSDEERHYPVTNVSFDDIYEFIFTLNSLTGLNFELPSAEEWEYAARGGENNETTAYAGSNDIDMVAWYGRNSGGTVHASDGNQGKGCNSLDLFDMSGNVSELCNTPFDTGVDGGRWTACGGNYLSEAEDVTVASRSGVPDGTKESTIGFRLILRQSRPL